MIKGSVKMKHRVIRILLTALTVFSLFVDGNALLISEAAGNESSTGVSSTEEDPSTSNLIAGIYYDPDYQTVMLRLGDQVFPANSNIDQILYDALHEGTEIKVTVTINNLEYRFSLSGNGPLPPRSIENLTPFLLDEDSFSGYYENSAGFQAIKADVISLYNLVRTAYEQSDKEALSSFSIDKEEFDVLYKRITDAVDGYDRSKDDTIVMLKTALNASSISVGVGGIILLRAAVADAKSPETFEELGQTLDAVYQDFTQAETNTVDVSQDDSALDPADDSTESAMEATKEIVVLDDILTVPESAFIIGPEHEEYPGSPDDTDSVENTVYLVFNDDENDKQEKWRNQLIIFRTVGVNETEHITWAQAETIVNWYADAFMGANPIAVNVVKEAIDLEQTPAVHCTAESEDHTVTYNLWFFMNNQYDIVTFLFSHANKAQYDYTEVVNQIAETIHINGLDGENAFAKN